MGQSQSALLDASGQGMDPTLVLVLIVGGISLVFIFIVLAT